MIPIGGLIQTALSKFGFFNADLSVIGLSYGTLLLAYAWGGYVLWRERQPSHGSATATQSVASEVVPA